MTVGTTEFDQLLRSVVSEEFLSVAESKVGLLTVWRMPLLLRTYVCIRDGHRRINQTSLFATPNFPSKQGCKQLTLQIGRGTYEPTELEAVSFLVVVKSYRPLFSRAEIGHAHVSLGSFYLVFSLSTDGFRTWNNRHLLSFQTQLVG